MATMDTLAVRVQRNFSLDPEHVRWIVRLARKEGHGNASRVLQRLIELEAIRRDGQDWRDRIGDEGDDGRAA